MADTGSILRGGRYVAVAWEFVGAIGAGAVIGWFADERLTTAPWGLMIGTLLAVVGAFMRLVLTLRRFDRLDAGRQR